MNLSASKEHSALSLAVEAVDSALISQISQFGRTCLGHEDASFADEYLHWLCLENPRGRAIAVIARLSGEVVGVALLIPMFLTHDHLLTRVNFVVNVLTHPEHRKRRLFSRIIDEARSFCVSRGEWLMGHPNAAALPGWIRGGMSFQPPLVPLIAAPSLARGARSLRLRSEQDLREVLPAVLQGAEVASGQVGIQRDVDFMIWRFLARPGVDHRLVVSRGKGGEVSGFSVSRRFRYGLDLVLDFGVTSGCRRALIFDRPSLLMVPKDRASEIAHAVGALRFPSRKEMPLFVSTFDGCNRDFSALTLAASDL